MRTVTASIVLTCALLALAQKRTTVVVPSQPNTATSNPQVPRMEAGSVEGHSYKNALIGMELMVPDGLDFQTPELSGKQDTLPLLVTITALHQEGLFSPRKVISFYADALAYYPEDQRSTQSYVAKVVRANHQEGYEPVGQGLRSRFGGIEFARTDFRGALYEAVLVKSCGAQAFVFIFASSNKDTVDALIGTTNLKLNPVRSGCGSSDGGNK